MQNEVIIQTQDGRNRYTFLQADDGGWRDATERATDPRPLKSPMLKWALTLAVSLADEDDGQQWHIQPGHPPFREHPLFAAPGEA